MMKKLYDYLYELGEKVYYQGQHKGQPTENIIVLKDGGRNGNRIVGKRIIDIIFFVPEYSDIEEYRTKIKNILKNYTDMKYTGVETGIVADDEKKAYTFSIMYEIYVAN